MPMKSSYMLYNDMFKMINNIIEIIDLFLYL